MITKGCPQGGIFSPTLWNIQLDDFLKQFNTQNAKAIAFADDITMIVWEKDSKKLQDKIIDCLNLANEWCKKVKLQISATKTNILYLFNGEKPSIPFEKTMIQPSSEIKILGVILKNHRHRNKIDFNPHINYLLAKGNRLKNALFTHCGRTWGIDYHKRITLLKAMIRPALAYGAEVWYPTITKRNANRLNSLQYQIVKRCTYTYNTTPTNVTHLLANIPLLTDFLHVKVLKHNIIHNNDIQDKSILTQLAINISDHYINTQKQKLLNNTNDTFRSFFPDDIPKHITPNTYTTPFFSGHGPFAKFLFTINKNTHPCCQCGEEETSLHTLSCTYTKHITCKYFPRHTRLHEYTSTKNNYYKFTKLCKEIYTIQMIKHNTQSLNTNS